MLLYSPVKYKVYASGRESTKVGACSPVRWSVVEHTACPALPSTVTWYTVSFWESSACLLYTSDAADEL